jgi:hypothetical protein
LRRNLGLRAFDRHAIEAVTVAIPFASDLNNSVFLHNRGVILHDPTKVFGIEK